MKGGGRKENRWRTLFTMNPISSLPKQWKFQQSNDAIKKGSSMKSVNSGSTQKKNKVAQVDFWCGRRKSHLVVPASEPAPTSTPCPQASRGVLHRSDHDRGGGGAGDHGGWHGGRVRTKMPENWKNAAAGSGLGQAGRLPSLNAQ